MADVGCCSCFAQDAEDKEQRIRSRIIDRTLAEERHRQRRMVKILLLGSGDSGKSTFLKQMRIINGKVGVAAD